MKVSTTASRTVSRLISSVAKRNIGYYAARSATSIVPLINKSKNASNNWNQTTIVSQLKTQQVHQVRFNSITTSTDGSDVPDSVLNLSIDDYHFHADETIELMYNDLDEFFINNDLPHEVEENVRVGEYFINKQPPNKQIWLSSPISGPKRFDYLDGEWTCLRDNTKLKDIIQDEVAENVDSSFQFSETF
ncbi:hypothetical protein B5S33_g2328 [[Candida] boidinii]|nr:hypothetical protein B5S30_g3671 [[Candida] boidinii]OWB83697.1 hypothetical protein B5S33_g2328 [[Candida] boidinii]